MKKIIFIVYFLFFSQSNGFAQDYIIEKFVSANPFPSAELYSIAEDDFGSKWIASDVGLLKITGNTVQHFTTNHNLEENVVLRLFPTPEGKIWIAGFNGSLAVIEKDSIKKIPLIEQIKNIKKNYYIKSLASEGKNIIYFNKNYPDNLCKLENDTILSVSNDKMDKITLRLYDGGQYLLNYPQISNNLYYDWHIIANKKEYILKKLFKNIINPTNTFLTLNDSTTYISNNNEVVELVHFKPVAHYILPKRVLCMQKIGNKVLFGVLNNGVFMIKNKEAVKIKNIDIDKLSVSHILLDKEENIWFTTLEKGLFVCRVPKAKSIYKGEYNTFNFIGDDDTPYILLSDNHTIRNGIIEKIPNFSNDILVYDIITQGKQNLYITSIGALYIKNDKLAYKGISRYMKGFAKMTDSTFYIIGSYSLYYLNIFKDVFSETLYDKVNCLEKYNNDFVLLGTQNKGVNKASIVDGNIHIKQITNNFRVNCIKKLNANLIVVGTNDKGVLLIDSTGKTLKIINNMPQRIDCLEYQDNILYIGTRTGLYVYDLVSNKMQLLSHNNFLPFDEIVKLRIFRKKELYILGKYEVIKIDINELNKEKIPFRIRIRHKLSKRNLFLYLEQNSYKYSQNIIFNIIILDKNGREIKHYKTTNKIFETELNNGVYTFQVYAIDDFVSIKSNIIALPILITPYYYETWWFWILCFMVCAFIIIYITYKIVHNVRKKELQKRLTQQKITDLESQALQAQMNPHFIFNAINSIQAFILQHKTEEAHYYLSEFAKLIRMILNHTRKRYVTIAEELALLSTYINIESERIKDTIIFQKNIAQEVDINEILLPTMLLQPIIENAIWHGFEPETNPKEIILTLSVEGEYIHIQLYNRGRKIMQNVRGSHISKGLKITQERILLAYPKKPNFEYFSMGNYDSGVLVKMILPFEVDF